MKTKKKKNAFDTARKLYEGRKLVLNVFKSGLFTLNSSKGTGLKYWFLKKCFKDYQ